MAPGRRPVLTHDRDTATAVFLVVPDRSALIVNVRSNVGPIEFGALGLTGVITMSWSNPLRIDPLSAKVELQVNTLTSGNALYDAELLRRVNARVFPTATVALEGWEALDTRKPRGPDCRFRVHGPVTFHGVTRSLGGVVSVTAGDDQLMVRGDEAFDIRDFTVMTPTMLILKIYPDVRVYLQVEAHRMK